MPLNNLTRTDLIQGLELLSDLAGKEGLTLEISIYGGAAMLLAFDSRPATKDVDAIVAPADAGLRLARKVAQAKDWHDGWLNDDVRMFLSPKETKHDWRPRGLEAPHLRLTKPTANYLLAMKAVALSGRRSLPGHAGDEQDLDFLIRKMKIGSLERVQEIVENYFPDTVLSDLALEIIRSIIKNARRTEP